MPQYRNHVFGSIELYKCAETVRMVVEENSKTPQQRPYVFPKAIFFSRNRIFCARHFGKKNFIFHRTKLLLRGRVCFAFINFNLHGQDFQGQKRAYYYLLLYGYNSTHARIGCWAGIIIFFYYMALSHKDWKLANSRIWLAQIDIDRGLHFPI